MNRYKFLRVDETEIEFFEKFLNDSALEGWHPVNHWASPFGIIKFSKDIRKSTKYTVVFNQAITGAQLKLNKNQTKRESDAKFKAFLKEFDVEHVMRYYKFDILYSEIENDVFTDREFQNDIIKKYIKEISIFLSALTVLYAIDIFLLVYYSKFMSFYLSFNLMRLVVYSLILIRYTAKFIKSIQYKKGKVKYNKKKWESTKNDLMSLLFPILNITILSLVPFMVIDLTKKFNILFIPIGLLMIFFYFYSAYRIENSKSTPESKIIHKFLVFFLAIIIFISFVSYSFNEKFIISYSDSPFNLSLTECNQTPSIDTSHSFFIQEYKISCDNDHVSIYKIKSPVYKKYFRDGAMTDLNIEQYSINEMYESEIRVIDDIWIPVYVFAKEDYILYTITPDNQLFSNLIKNLK